MEAAGHLLDFAERLSALTDMEAVKDAYLDYVATMFATYRVIRTPGSLPGGGLRLVDSSSELGQLHLMEDWESCLHDELICIIGRRGSLGCELGDWLERPRQIVHDRLERLLLNPKSEGVTIGTPRTLSGKCGGEGGHDGGVGARLGGPKGPLSAGAARRLPEP